MNTIKAITFIAIYVAICAYAHDSLLASSMFAISTIWLFGRSFFGGSIMAGLKRFGFAVLTLVTTVMILPQPSSEQLAESKAAQAKLGRSLDAAFNASTGRSGAIKGK